MRSGPLLLVMSLMLGCSASGGGADPALGPDGSVLPPDDGGGVDVAPALELAKNLTISEVAVFQGVKVSIAKDGAAVSPRKAPVVAGREGIVRVYVTPGADWTPREVTATLTITPGSGDPIVITEVKKISGASDDASLNSTFNLQLGKGQLDAAASYLVTLKTMAGQPDGPSDGASYPSNGSSESFDARNGGSNFKLVLVPIKYNADGSGRLPDLADAGDAWRKAIYGFYPVADIDFSVHDPVNWPGAINPDGSGWSDVLQQVLRLRQRDGVSPQTFYYGIFTPTRTVDEFCGGGCVGGLAPVPMSASDSSTRGAVGLGWQGELDFGTIAQELAHSLGRLHAPCGGASNVDPKFPYKTSNITSWGYDINSHALVDPTTKDFMSYCQPVWTSDYTFNAIFNRLAYINGGTPNFLGGRAPAEKYRFVTVGMHGELTWGQETTLAEAPSSEPRTLTYVASDGRVIGKATGYWYPYQDIAGGFLLVPEPAIDFATMQITGLPPGAQSTLSRALLR